MRAGRAVRRRRVRELAAVVAAVAGALVLGAAPAGAHVDVDPGTVRSGEAVTLSLRVQHGCGESPTNEMVVAAPTGVTDLAPVAKEGWTTSVAPDRVTFRAAAPPATPGGSFAVRFTVPGTAGRLYVPVVQRCVQGEHAWIEIPEAGGSEPQSPAPFVEVAAGAPSTDAPGTATPTTAAPTTAVTPERTVALENTAASGDGVTAEEDDGGTDVGLLLGVGLVVMGVILFVRRRRGG
jgi:periplasmic copper chaperone A